MQLTLICESLSFEADERHPFLAESPMQSATLNLPRPAVGRSPLPRLRSEQLFGNSHELIIEHQGQEYRLRLTRNDKLILNK